MKTVVQKLSIGIAALLAIVGISGALFIWQFNRPPFDLALLERLRPGMPATEVRQILGAPKSAGDHEWAYSLPMAWPIVYVRFDEQSRFREHEYDY